MLIVEGMDNTGKTTLIDYIVARIPFCKKVVSRSDLLFEKKIDEFMSWTYDHIYDSQTANVVYDRFPVISEGVYGPVLRGVNLFHNSTEWLDALKRLRNPFIIYCRPDAHVILNWGNNEHHGTEEHIKGFKANGMALIDAYDDMMVKIAREHGFFIKRYDYRINSLPKLISLFQSYLSNPTIINRVYGDI